MNERQLTAFRHVLRLGSVTAAANAMSVSQPAVSRLWAELEASIGFPLFERRSGKLIPLPEARALGGEVERMFYGLERLGQFARELRGMQHARVSAATLPMASFHILPQAVQKFLAAHDHIHVSHNVHTSPRIVDLVAAGQADIGIAQLTPARADVRRIAGWRSACVVALPAGHKLADRPVITPRDLDGIPMVALAHQTITASYVAERFAEAGVHPLVHAESQPSYSACGLVAQGIGPAIVDPFTPLLFPAERIVTVPFSPTTPFDIYLVAHSERPLSRAAEALVGFLCDEMDGCEGAERISNNIGEWVHLPK
ncbi:MAG: LysR substrate-binding domain-containing protein [Pseudomonadota bacterium]